MLSLTTVNSDRDRRVHITNSIERLIHCWVPGRSRSAAAHASIDLERGVHAPGDVTPGFDWHAPLYQRPLTLKDTRFMHNPAHDDLPGAPASAAEAFRWRRHPALLKLQEVPPLPQAERDARKAAVCGVLAARDGDLDRAAFYFAKAASEPSIRFQVVPGFWSCSRGGMDAAVAAYEDAGRFRDAATLAATIRTRYRPRALADAGHGPRSQSSHQAVREASAVGTGD